MVRPQHLQSLEPEAPKAVAAPFLMASPCPSASLTAADVLEAYGSGWWPGARGARGPRVPATVKLPSQRSQEDGH